ncbi:hypothetical protein Leryth_016789, partial [Lithospermum erythrorhizon]
YGVCDVAWRPLTPRREVCDRILVADGGVDRNAPYLMKSSQNPISFHLLSNPPPSSNEDDDFADLDNAMEALLKGVPMNFSAYSNQNNSQLGFGEFGNGHSLLNLKSDKKWSCWG